MRSFRKFALMAAMAVILAFAFTAGAWAQQTTSGSAVVGLFGQTGDQTNGGFSNANGGASYSASDPTKASGSADATGVGNNSLTTHNNVVKAISSGGIKTGADANGGTTSIGFGGDTNSATYIGLGGSTTYANGGTITDGNYSGTANSDAPLQGSGSAISNNETIGSSTGDGTNHAESAMKVIGSSKANAAIDGQCLPTAPVTSAAVSGNAGANLGALAGNLNGSFAGASATGATQFSASNPNGAEGSQSIVGSTAGNVANNGGTVSAASKISSKAQAH